MKFTLANNKVTPPTETDTGFLNIAPYFVAGQRLQSWNAWNKAQDIISKTTQNFPTYHIPPEQRVSIPCGLVVDDIPEEHCLEVEVMEEAVMTQGLECPVRSRFFNGDEVYINFHNISDSLSQVKSGQMIAIGKLVHIISL